MLSGEIPITLDLLERISTFVLNRTLEDFRSDLYEHLVMMVLNEDKTSKGIGKEQIISSLEKDLQVKELPSSLVLDALTHLLERNAVKKIRGRQGDLYFLAQDERTRIGLMEEQFAKTTAQVKTDLSKKMKEKGLALDMSEEAIAFATFRNFLSLALSQLGKECCLGLIFSHSGDLGAFKPVNVTNILDDVMKTVEDVRLRQIEREVFIESISNPSDALSDLLYSLAQSYFFVQILHLDPECQQLTAESLKRKRVYLDTNIIHHSLIGVERRNKAVDYALKLTAALGINTVMSKRTKEEFIDLLESRKKTFRKDLKIPSKRFNKVSNDLEDGFLKDFLTKKRDNPNLTFERYADRLEEIETVLGNRYSTTFDDTDYKDILENPELLQLRDVVIREGEKFALQKSDKVAEHDAFHILLIQEMRKKSVGDILGPDFWFLTHDRSLSYVEERYGKYERFPSSIFVDTWVQLVSPLLSPKQTKDTREAYVGLFASRLPRLSAAIDEEAFAAFQGKWMDDENLKPKDIARVIGNRFVRDAFETAKVTEKPISDEDREKMLNPIIAEIKTQNREMVWMNRQITELQKELSDVKKSSQKQKSTLSQLGHVFSAFLFLAMWLLFYEFFVRVHFVEHWAALLGSMMLAAIIGALADLKGYKWLVERLLRYKSSETEK